MEKAVPYAIFQRAALRDSKNFPRNKEKKWFDLVLGWKSEDKCNFAVSYVEAKEIDEINYCSCCI